MNIIRAIGLLTLLSALVGCEDDPVALSCQNYAVNLGQFYLKESTANLFPYAETDTNIIFKNELNEELVFTRTVLIRDTITYSTIDECPFDSMLQVPYSRTTEQIIAFFINDSLDLGFQFSFQALFRSNGDEVTGESDVAYVSFSPITYPDLVSVFGLSSLIVHKSGLTVNTYNNYYSSITLGSKTFDNVFATKSIPNFPPTYITYMNYDKGIVGIEIPSSGMLWTFDRVE
jgi:hypothetical protein